MEKKLVVVIYLIPNNGPAATTAAYLDKVNVMHESMCKNALILDTDISSQHSAYMQRKWIAVAAPLYPPSFYNQSAFPSFSLASWKNRDKSLILLNIKGLNVHAKNPMLSYLRLLYIFSVFRHSRKKFMVKTFPVFLPFTQWKLLGSSSCITSGVFIFLCHLAVS